MKRKAIAIILTAFIGFSLSGCSLLRGSKIGPSRLAGYGRDSGAEEYDDPDEWEEDMDEIAVNSDWTTLDDGVYITVEDRDIKGALKVYEPGLVSFYDKSMTEATIYVTAQEKNNKRTTVIACAYTFDSKDNALGFYEDWTDTLDDQYEADKENNEVDFDTFEEGNMQYALFCEDSYTSFSVGIYTQGKDVFLIFGAGSESKKINSALDEVCEAMGVYSPGDL